MKLEIKQLFRVVKYHYLFLLTLTLVLILLIKIFFFLPPLFQFHDTFLIVPNTIIFLLLFNLNSFFYFLFILQIKIYKSYSLYVAFLLHTLIVLLIISSLFFMAGAILASDVSLDNVKISINQMSVNVTIKYLKALAIFFIVSLTLIQIIFYRKAIKLDL